MTWLLYVKYPPSRGHTTTAMITDIKHLPPWASAELREHVLRGNGCILSSDKYISYVGNGTFYGAIEVGEGPLRLVVKDDGFDETTVARGSDAEELKAKFAEYVGLTIAYNTLVAKESSHDYLSTLSVSIFDEDDNIVEDYIQWHELV